jgi:DNA mismatch repair protein MutS2
LQLIKGKNAVVQFGDLKSVINLEKLEKLTSSGQAQVVVKRSSSGININDKRATFNETLDVRGKRVEELASLLDHFLDNSILLSQAEVRILHGKGEGVLRKVVREQLKKYKDVASVRDEHIERGGDGITIVVLK